MTRAIQKIREHGHGLKIVSGERIWMEMKKIVSGNFAPEILARMRDCQLMPYLGLPDDPDLAAFADRHPILRANDANPAVFLSTLFRNEDQLNEAQARMKFSNDEYLLAHFVLTRQQALLQMVGRDSIDSAVEQFQDEFVMHVGEPAPSKLRMCFHEFFKYADRLDMWTRFDAWRPPRFPIRGNELATKWDVKGW